MPHHTPTAGVRELLSGVEAADFLRITPRTLNNYRRLKPGFPQPLLLSANHQRWRRSELLAWLESRRHVESPPPAAVATEAGALEVANHVA